MNGSKDRKMPHSTTGTHSFTREFTKSESSDLHLRPSSVPNMSILAQMVFQDFEKKFNVSFFSENMHNFVSTLKTDTKNGSASFFLVDSLNKYQGPSSYGS